MAAASGRRRRVLMLAYHYPPMKGSSGLQRTLHFTRHLPHLGWEPRVLTVWPGAYPAISDEQMADIPPDVRVRRLPCLDASRHLSIGGAYPDVLARPDRWWSWLLTAVPAGLMDCLSWKPDLIWSTYPIATAVRAGGVLSRLTGLPWVVDLRDSMTEDHYPPDPRLRNALRRIEARAVNRAQAVVFTSPGAQRMYAARYAHINPSVWHHIPNGYDEDSFVAAEALPARPPAQPIHLVHSGLLDPVDRNPRAFFNALARLKKDGKVSSAQLRITLRATGHDGTYRPMLEALDIADLVHLAPVLPYLETLREMMDAHGLLVFQAGNCNHQTPAKLYEYLRAGKPILAMTDPAGDTAAALRAGGFDDAHIAPIEREAEIARLLVAFLDAQRAGGAPGPDMSRVRTWSRAGQSEVLAALFSTVLSA